MKYLILGGTARARRLATRLARRFDVIYSLAGVTDKPRLPLGCVLREGSFGGVGGMVNFIRANRIDCIIDASHPHAIGISANAAEAAAHCSTPVSRLRWRPWRAQPGDRWREFETTGQMIEALKARAPSRVLLALGARASAPFTTVHNHRFWLRAINAPDLSRAASEVELISARGPFDETAERALLTRHGIELVLCKNSGLRDGRAKLDAARRLAAEVWLLKSPSSET